MIMITPDNFYSILPKRKAELVDGKLLIGGSLEVSAMTLRYLIEHLGAKEVSELVPIDLLCDAVIEVYGRGIPVQPPSDNEIAKPYYTTLHKLANDLQMGLSISEANVSGGNMVIRLGDDAFTPDLFLIKQTNNGKLKLNYFDGAPDLAIEVVSLSTKAVDYRLRLDKYAAGGIPEVWTIDYEKRTFEPLVLENNKYKRHELVHSSKFESPTISGFTIQYNHLFDSVDTSSMYPLQIFEVPKILKDDYRMYENTEIQLPFLPRFDLDPVPIRFEEFIFWGGPVKFEFWGERPVFGGTEENTKEWLGLLIMTFGVREAINCLPADAWSAIL
jgi:hypothetical protein